MPSTIANHAERDLPKPRETKLRAAAIMSIDFLNQLTVSKRKP
jgi:hypothetical protein